MFRGPARMQWFEAHACGVFEGCRRVAPRQIVCGFIDHTQARAEAGAPFEWINPELSSGDGKW